jgi:hypothetical protein
LQPEKLAATAMQASKDIRLNLIFDIL